MHAFSSLLLQSEASWDLPFAMLVGIGVGGALVFVLNFVMGASRIASAKREADGIVEQGRLTTDKIIKTAELDALTERDRVLEQFKSKTAGTRAELKALEKRLVKREDNLDRKLDTLTAKEKHLDSIERKANERAAVLEEQDRKSQELLAQREQELVRVSGLGRDDAKRELMAALEEELTHESGQLISDILGEARDNAEAQAREITLTAIQRYAADNTSEGTVSTVDIPSDDMKGRVIGREGRNIRAFEKATGVDVIVDDTPGVVVVSSFDPVRR
ncbi:MAG: Rnase Y domain-containing protein, partial [Phycisphaerae bacterium]